MATVSTQTLRKPQTPHRKHRIHAPSLLHNIAERALLFLVIIHLAVSHDYVPLNCVLRVVVVKILN